MLKKIIKSFTKNSKKNKVIKKPTKVQLCAKTEEEKLCVYCR